MMAVGQLLVYIPTPLSPFPHDPPWVLKAVVRILVLPVVKLDRDGIGKTRHTRRDDQATAQTSHAS